MKKILLSLLLVAVSLTAVQAPASAATYDGSTLEELYQDPTLHDQHSVVIRFYAAVFARTPDNDGIRFWLDQYDTGDWSTRRIADFFVTSDEFEQLYGAGTTNSQFVDAVYPNVLGRQPDAGGRSFWIGFLDDGNSRAEMILLVSNSPEFIDANPLPSDTRSVPAPINTEQFFDGLMGYNNVPFPTDNVISQGTYADLYVEYIAANERLFGASPSHSSRVDVTNGFRYSDGQQDPITLTDPRLDASGRIANFRINGSWLNERSELRADNVPDLGLGLASYQYITTSGLTALRIVFANDSSIDQETYAFDWDFTSPSGQTTKAVDWTEPVVIPAGGILEVIVFYDADGQIGGSLDVEIFFEQNGESYVQELTLDFEAD